MSILTLAARTSQILIIGCRNGRIKGWKNSRIKDWKSS